jgi:hypothetical protein
MSTTVAVRSKARNVNARSNAEIVSSNPTRGMSSFSCVCVALPRDRLIPRPWSHIYCLRFIVSDSFWNGNIPDGLLRERMKKKNLLMTKAIKSTNAALQCQILLFLHEMISRFLKSGFLPLCFIPKNDTYQTVYCSGSQTMLRWNTSVPPPGPRCSTTEIK